MARITNNAGRALGLPGALPITLQADQSVEVSQSHADALHKNHTFKHWLKAGLLSVDGVKSKSKQESKVSSSQPELPDQAATEGVHIEKNGAWFRVLVDGVDVLGKSVRKAEAEEAADKYR